MNKKSDDLLQIEQCFSAIKDKDDIKTNLRRITRTLERIFDLTFHIEICNNTTTNFFGMNIYPDETTMDKMVEGIVSEKSQTATIVRLWQETKDWHVEIDSILLFDNNLNANPGEITSVLLHEVGHIIYSNSIPQRLNKVLRFKLMKLSYDMRQLIATEKLRKLFNLAIVESCTTKNFNYINTEKEKIADKFVVSYGYTSDINSLINKLIASQGNQLVNRSDVEMEKELNIIVNWTVDNIKQLEFRKSALKHALSVEMLKTPSNIIKRTVQDIYYSFFSGINDKYRMLLSESFSLEAKDVVAELEAEQNLVMYKRRIMEEALVNIFDKVGKIKKVNQTDIDIIAVEIDRISTVDDKIYLLDRVHEKLELIDMAIEYIDLGKGAKVTQSKELLQTFKKRLEELRTEILSMKIVPMDYGVFIKYPKGYKG